MTVAIPRILTLLLLMLQGSPLAARAPNSLFSGCTNDSYASVDGCSGAEPDGTVRYPSFFTVDAPQVRQVYRSLPPWYVAGVQYPVGISASAYNKAGYVLTPRGLKDPTSAANWAIDNPTVTFGTTGSPMCNYGVSKPNTVFCGSGLGPRDLLFDAYDSAPNGNCIRWLLPALGTGTYTFKNSYFEDTPTCEVATSSNLISGGGSGSLVLTQNQFEGNSQLFSGWTCWTTTGCMTDMVAWTRSTKSITATYNFIENQGGRFLSGNSSGDSTYEYNLVHNITGISAHGEFTLTSTNGGSPNFVESYNTMWQDARMPFHVAVTAFIAPTATASHFTTADVSGNTLVANSASYDNAPTVAYLIETAGSTIASTFTSRSNYFDLNTGGAHRGAFGCFYPSMPTGATTISGNVNIVTGLPANAKGASASCY